VKKSILVNQKSRRFLNNARGDPIGGLHLRADLPQELDAWCAARELSRSERIRRLVKLGRSRRVAPIRELEMIGNKLSV
jgi:hypothetical protein